MRTPTEKVLTSRKRKNSSSKWLQRQLNDPYVIASKNEGYRSRAAYKLIELNTKYNFLKRGKKVLELGSSPGAWTQVLCETVGSKNIVSVDINNMNSLDKVKFIQLDILEEESLTKIIDYSKMCFDIVLSDMAAPSTGHSHTDHLRTMLLCDASYKISKKVLKPGGIFLSKVIQGGTEKNLLNNLKLSFSKVKHVKPPASRSESAELYVFASGFRM